MKKMLAILICAAILCSFAACHNNRNLENETNPSWENNPSIVFDSNVVFTETENKTIVANGSTEYTFVGFEYQVWSFGEREFIGHVQGEKERFTHLYHEILTGMYSVNGSHDILVRYFPDNEFSGIYVRSGLLKKEAVLDNCIRFELVTDLIYDDQTRLSNKGITECEQFLEEIKSGQTAKDAGLYDLVRQPNGMFKNCYGYGYVCGVLQEDLNLVIPLPVISFDDQAYSIEIDGTQYVLPQEWFERLTDE